MACSKIKYFNAMTFNKRNEFRLKETELKLDKEQKKMITKFWRDKYNLLDDLVQINVKTPKYVEEKDKTEASEVGNTCIDLGEMKIDDKLFSTKPISCGGSSKKKEGLSMSPVIEVEGSEAICYPNKEAKRGRHVSLPNTTTRRMEAVRYVYETLESLSQQKGTRKMAKPNLFRTQRHSKPALNRPLTAAPRMSSNNARVTNIYHQKRPKTSFS